MNLAVTGKHIQITDAIRSYIAKKMERIKFYFPHVIDVHLVLEVEKKINNKIEVTVIGDGKVFHSEFKAEDMYQSIDGLIDRLERQVKRYKEKLHSFTAKRVAVEMEKDNAEKTDFIFTKVREIFPKPMSDTEAILQLKTSDYKFNIYKKAPELTEEDFKKLAEKDIVYQKTVLIKESDTDFVVISKTNSHWEERVLKMEDGKVKDTNKQGSISVEEKTVEEAALSLLGSQKKYSIFFDKDLKNLSIVYKRKNNSLGLIIGNPNGAN